MSKPSTIHSKPYRNWVRGALGLLYLQEGLYPFTDRVVKAEHSRILQSLTPCTSCTVRNILPAHASGKVCIHRNRAKCNCRRNINTPCNTCSNIYDEIIKLHRFKDPTWVTDASTWCTDHWQIAKCFMTTTTLGSNNTAADTGAAGLLSIILNGLFFQSEIQCSINPPNDVFCQVRGIHNEIMRNLTLELSDMEVTKYLQGMIDVLEDQKTLISDPSAQEAVRNLKEMIKQQLVITTNEEATAIQTALDAIKDDKTITETEIYARKKPGKLEDEERQSQELIDYKIKRKDETNGPSLQRKQEDKRYRAPKDTCIFDGRLLKLEKTDIDKLDMTCIEEIGSGGFGKVFKSKTVLEGFGIRVAVKKTSTGRNDHQDEAVRRERIASRIMHPFILPLLAIVDRPKGTEVWFVSPYCENGDLHSAIKASKMDHFRRLKILLQIALAIQYIHTAVPNVRDVILHKDISSKNVVLDTCFNARLIDFGLAREKKDATSYAVGRTCYAHPDIGKGTNATESWDYYAFGVVIREMLTGLGPDGCNGKYLKNMEVKEIRDELKELVWPKVDVVTEMAEKLNNIAQKCLQAGNWAVSDFSRQIVAEMKDIWIKCNFSKLFDTPDNDRCCHICIINPVAKVSSMKQEHNATCTQEIKVCIACEKNSFLNPITCYCGAALKPGIGCKWGALLVAGNDVEKTQLAEALTKDLTELKKVITSRAPLIMGISEDKVRIVVPEKPGKPKAGEEAEKLWPKVKEEIKYFSKATEIDTLLIYLSCHGTKGNGTGDVDSKNRFELGSVSDCLSSEDFEKELESLGNIDKLIIFLDRCYPPMLKLSSRIKYIQINACKADKKALFNDEGSAFTKYLIQGLKAKSEKTCSDTCQDCVEYWGNSRDFISVQNLFAYVNSHIKDEAPTPDWQQGSNWSNIAFFTDEVVEIGFTSDNGSGEVKHVPLGYLQSMRQLKEKLLEEFGKDKSSTNVRIQKDTYRKAERFEDCKSLEMVMSAWVHRHPLNVKFQETKNRP